MVITPLFADQPDNARCLDAAGLCVSVPEVDAASLRAAIIKALNDDEMRERAQAEAREVANMPTLSQTIDILLGG